MIDIKIKLKDSKLRQFLRRLVRKNPTARYRALQNTALKQVNTILTRTDRGRGVDGNFKRYTKNYEEFKRSIGQSGRPNLQVSNFMLSNIKVKGNNDKASLFFSNQKANELAFYNDKTRPFFSVTDKEEKQLIDNFAKQFYKFLNI